MENITMLDQRYIQHQIQYTAFAQEKKNTFLCYLLGWELFTAIPWIFVQKVPGNGKKNADKWRAKTFDWLGFE